MSESEQLSEMSEQVPDLGSPPSPLPSLWDCDTGADACTDSCSDIFERVKVFPVIQGGTRVEWKISENFGDAQPHEFRLQVGHTANPEADDWEWVGLSSRDAWYMIDDTQRVYGKTQWTHYRVALATPAGRYFSKPVRAVGTPSYREWRLAAAILRDQSVRLKKAGAGEKGYLLKRKLYGTKCSECIDFQTGEVLNHQCDTCYGTGFVGGYFPAMPCVYADLSNRSSRDHIDPGGRGTVNDDERIMAEMLGSPHVMQNDIWVDAASDNRWVIHATKVLQELGGVPLLIAAELRLAPYSDVIYSVPVEEGDLIS